MMLIFDKPIKGGNDPDYKYLWRIVLKFAADIDS